MPYPKPIETRTGNFALVYLDGNLVGLCQSVRGQVGFTVQPVYEIGNIDPVENVPTRAVYSVTIRKITLRRDDPLVALIPINGEEALRNLLFDIEVYDKRDDGETSLLKKWIGCTYDSGTIGVDANQIVVKDASFRALAVDGSGL